MGCYTRSKDCTFHSPVKWNLPAEEFCRAPPWCCHVRKMNNRWACARGCLPVSCSHGDDWIVCSKRRAGYYATWRFEIRYRPRDFHYKWEKCVSILNVKVDSLSCVISEIWWPIYILLKRNQNSNGHLKTCDGEPVWSCGKALAW